MFSIENLLSDKYSSSSSSTLKKSCCKDDVAHCSEKTDSLAMGESGVTEITTERSCSAAGKRDVLHPCLQAENNLSSATKEREMKEEKSKLRRAGDAGVRSRKRKSNGESCGDSESERDSEMEEGM